MYTVGHSTLPIERFLAVLRAHGIERLADVRTVPRSRRNPQFNAEALALSLRAQGLEYVPLRELGGLRKPRADSPNAGWRNDSFRGYADYMETADFDHGITRLLEAAKSKATAIMCAERSWRSCHRGLIADHLKASGIEVIHILDTVATESHPWTVAARMIAGRLSYSAAGIDQQQLPF